MQVKENKSQVVMPSQASERIETIPEKGSVSLEPQGTDSSDKQIQMQDEHRHVVFSPQAQAMKSRHDKTEKSLPAAASLGLVEKGKVAAFDETKHQEVIEPSEVKDAPEIQQVLVSESSDLRGATKTEEIVTSKQIDHKKRKAAVSKPQEQPGIPKVTATPQEQQSTLFTDQSS